MSLSVTSTNSFSSFYLDTDPNFVEEQSSPSIGSLFESDISSPLPFRVDSLNLNSASPLHKIDSCKKAIFSPFRLKISVDDAADENLDPNRSYTVQNSKLDAAAKPRPSFLKIAVEDEAIDENLDSNTMYVAQDSKLGRIADAVNNQSALFRVDLLPREKQLNEVFIIRRDGLAEALFKPEETSSGSDRKLGLTGSIRNAVRNEVIACKLAGMLTRTFVLPIAEATFLRVGLSSTISMVGDDSDASSMAALVPGTIHEFVTNAKALKDCGPQASQFFSSHVTAVKQRTQLIAALHILSVYLDGNAGNLLLDGNGYPVAIDFAEILPAQFRIGARPPCWVQATACKEPFDAAVIEEIAQLKWDKVAAGIADEPNFSLEESATLNLSLALLQKGAEKSLSPNNLASFIIGERPTGIFEKEFRSPSAMHLIYKACVSQGKVDEGKLDKLLDFGMEFVIKKMVSSTQPLVGDAHYAYQEQIAISLKSHLEGILS